MEDISTEAVWTDIIKAVHYEVFYMSKYNFLKASFAINVNGVFFSVRS
jgi:hypothetical protein